MSQNVADEVNRAVLEYRKQRPQAPDGHSGEVLEEAVTVESPE